LLSDFADAETPTRIAVNRRLSDPIKELVMDEVIRRNDKAVHVDDGDVAKLVMMFERMHPDLAVAPEWRKEPPSPSVVSEFCRGCGLTVQRATAKKRALSRPTFEAEAKLAVENINRFPMVATLDEWHANAGDTPKKGRGLANSGVYVAGHIRDKQSWTNITLLFLDP
jgi:hypothetical protein